jgi:hypothetical protein
MGSRSARYVRPIFTTSLLTTTQIGDETGGPGGGVVAPGQVGLGEDRLAFVVGEQVGDGDQPAELVEEAGDGPDVEPAGLTLAGREHGLGSVSALTQNVELRGHLVGGKDTAFDGADQPLDAGL